MNHNPAYEPYTVEVWQVVPWNAPCWIKNWHEDSYYDSVSFEFAEDAERFKWDAPDEYDRVMIEDVDPEDRVCECGQGCSLEDPDTGAEWLEWNTSAVLLANHVVEDILRDTYRYNFGVTYCDNCEEPDDNVLDDAAETAVDFLLDWIDNGPVAYVNRVGSPRREAEHFERLDIAIDMAEEMAHVDGRNLTPRDYRPD